ncbi:MAG: LptF/LptG family permease, partial [Bacteroidales bacterium]|nr:LptF/LptG family permease [Bacteroidales bacterium]
LNNKDKLAVIRGAYKSVKIIRSNIENNGQSLENRLKWLKKHELAWYKKFSLSFACLVFFFIGAPLGAIIRTGGFGFPFLISVVLFMFYYVLYITGDKSAVENAVPVFVGAWLASGILFPLGVFITYKATKDSKIVNKEQIETVVKKILHFLKISK